MNAVCFAMRPALAALWTLSAAFASAGSVSLDRREYVRRSLAHPDSDARKLLRTYAQKGAGRKPILSAPKMIVRGQFRYGNDRDDFIHAWYERPLYQDSSLIASRETGHFVNAESWKLDVRCMKEAGFDAFAFFPKNPGCSDIFGRSVLPGGEATIVPQFAEMYMRTEFGFREHVKMAGRLLDTPNALRFNGRVVIPCYGSIGWWETERIAKLKRLRKELCDRYGEGRFAVIPWFRLFKDHELNPPELSARVLRETRDGLCNALRDFDGFFYSLLDMNWMPYECSDLAHTDVVIPLVRSIFAEPEFKDRFLGLEYYTGHQNTYLCIATFSCMGLERLRRTFESIRALQPDFTWASEWDEANENDHLAPTVSGGKSVTRMVRHYADLMAGRPQTPLPGDDVSIPNLVLSYRKALVLGERIEAQVVNIPDGTAAGDFRVSFRWLAPDGRVVRSFPARRLPASDCRQETFAVPSVELASERILLPELTVVDSHGRKHVFDDGLWPLGLEGTRTLDSHWVRQPLREICRGVSGALAIGPRESDGTFVVTGSVKGPRRFRSVEVLENSDSAYMYDAANAKPKDGVDIAVCFKSTGHIAERDWPQGTVRLVTPRRSETGDCGKPRDFKDFRFFVPNEDVADALIEIDLPQEGFVRKVPVADIVRVHARSYALDDGGQATVRRAFGTHRIPPPAMTNRADFAFRMRPLDPSANLRLQVVDEDYHVWRGPLASFYRPSGKLREIHVLDEDDERSKTVEVDQSRLYAVKYDFMRAREDDLIYPENVRLDSPCAFGGSVSLVTGVGHGHEDCWYQHALCGFGSVPKIEKGMRFASLPMQFNPWRAGFKLSIRIRPTELSGRQYLLDSWVLGFQLFLDNDVPTAYISDAYRIWKSGVNATDGTTVTGPPLKPGQWSRIDVVFDQAVAYVVTDGVKGEALPAGGCESNPHPMALGCTVFGKDFFTGDIAEISVAPR